MQAPGRRERHRALLRQIALLPLLAFLLAGCNGGTVDMHALQNDSDAIDSLACEGALLANEIANDASISTFSRVHAGQLQQRAANFENALSKRPTTPGIEKAVRDEAKKAGAISDLLGRLHENATDPATAADLKGRLEQQGGCA
jgi:hypothetical protein